MEEFHKGSLLNTVNDIVSQADFTPRSLKLRHILSAYHGGWMSASPWQVWELGEFLPGVGGELCSFRGLFIQPLCKQCYIKRYATSNRGGRHDTLYLQRRRHCASYPSTFSRKIDKQIAVKPMSGLCETRNDGIGTRTAFSGPCVTAYYPPV